MLVNEGPTLSRHFSSAIGDSQKVRVSSDRGSETVSFALITIFVDIVFYHTNLPSPLHTTIISHTALPIFSSNPDR